MGRSRLLIYGLVVVVLVAAGLAGALIANSINTPSTATTTATGTGGAASTASTCDVPTVAEQQLPSVVTIQAGSGEGAGTGSGEVIRANGYILTNNHVIVPAAGGGSLHVLFEDGRVASASIVGRDPLTDLAVIRVEGQSGLRPIPIGNSSEVRVGQPVVALGAPLGLSSTVTSGIISALDRMINVPAEGSQTALLVDALQTDAAINPGNSGGALVDCNGDLIGIPTAGATVPSPSGQSAGGSIGLGFAIPVNLAKEVSDEIISTGRVTHAFVGVNAQALPPEGSGGAQGGGLWISGLVPDGPAARAGLQEGDIIRSIDGTAAVSTEQLLVLSVTKRPGDRVEIGYERDGQSRRTTITLGTRP